MAEPARRVPHMTAEEYLVIERDAVTKHEFANGLVYAMAGTTKRHNAIATELLALANARLRGTACVAYALEVKVRIETPDEVDYFYPDVFVTCDDDEGDELASDKPILVVEVASPSTEDYDSNEKFDAYRLSSSLMDYGLLSQNERKLTLHRRRSGWKPEIFGPADEVTFECIGLTVSIADIYSRSRLDNPDSKS